MSKIINPVILTVRTIRIIVLQRRPSRLSPIFLIDEKRTAIIFLTAHRFVALSRRGANASKANSAQI